MREKQTRVILMADDDADDRAMAKEALDESKLKNPLHFVEDGEQLMDYLHRRGAFASLGSSPPPALILLDLNMPKKDGREALQEIKAHPTLRQIPIVVMTTSKAEEDIVSTYDLGANSFISKPVTFEGLLHVVKTIGEYWFELVVLPPEARR